MPQVVWLRGKEEVREGGRVKMAYDEEGKVSSLKIADSVVEDSDTYTVKLTNDVCLSIFLSLFLSFSLAFFLSLFRPFSRFLFLFCSLVFCLMISTNLTLISDL